MGDMADFVNDCLPMGFNPKPKYSFWWVAKGPGKCPACGKDTIKKLGKYGYFYGCIDFPKCKGTRSI